VTPGVAVVTGASAGIGRATALRLAGAGYSVALLARGRAGLDGAAASVRDHAADDRVRALPIVTDVASWEEVDAAASKAEDELGPIDVWVNSAMTTVFGPLEDVSAAEIKRTTEVTYLGQVHGTMAALERMRPRDRGRIVNVGSSLAFVGIPLQAAYCGAKFAVRGFTESVRAELLGAGSGVTISQVHLPAVDTPQFDWCESKLDRKAMPVPPVYDPDVAAKAILAAAVDGRPHSIVGSWNAAIVTLERIVPGILARFAARTAVESQQTDEPEGERPSNLWSPVDDEDDHGVHGRFAAQSGGVTAPTFLASIPGIARDFARATYEELRAALR
jgi:short-subunit dehydrogenase